ncbi:hypothetical protein BGW41_002566 [Actinomortierella wolfii]|nr:hypothetical protein BGW41_002566 [Actinomortierella wolfii]
MNLISSSFSANDRDFSLDNRFSLPPATQTQVDDEEEEDNSRQRQQQQAWSPRLRNKLSAINPFRSSASVSSMSEMPTGSDTPTRTASPPPAASQGGLYSNPFASRTPSPAPSSPSLKKSIGKNGSASSRQKQRPLNPYVNHPSSPYQSYSQQQNSVSQRHPSPLQPPAPIPGMQQTTALSQVSSYNSYYEQESTNSSSENRSYRNLGAKGDQSYNLTQSDLTLEGLAERWNAYQAMMAKYYREVPFYRRWTKSKWVLILSVLLLSAYSVAGLVVALGYLTKRIEHAALVLEFHSNMVYLCLVGSVVGIVTAIIGAVGIWREDRVWLSVYNLLLWVVFALNTAIGYIAFLRVKDFLRQTVQKEWVNDYTREQRLLVQREMRCCGYISSKSDAAYDLRCFPGTVLPPCRSKYLRFEGNTLNAFWTASFALVPVELFVMLAALLCANHVDGMWRSARPGLVSFKEEKDKWQ